MKRHPGGTEHTLNMLRLSGLTPPASILDMGAGAGEALEAAEEMGFRAVGIDLEPRRSRVQQGDYLTFPWEEGSFDGVLSQCSFYVSGDARGAVRQAFRVLKPGGVLMLSDVYPVEEDPEEFAREAGFEIMVREDMTPLWRQYYIQAIWDDEAICIPTGRKYRYKMLIAGKPEK